MSSTEAEMLGEMSGEMAICVPVSTLRYLSNDLLVLDLFCHL